MNLLAPQSLADITARLQGYDPQAISAEAVLRILGEWVTPLQQTETLPLMQALGRVLAQGITSPISVPPHDNSAMDGFAFHGSALHADAPTRLQVVGTAFAGKAWQGQATASQCVKIMTGAVMPAGLDTVVPLELVQTDGDSITLPARAVKPGDNRRLAGEDLMQGQQALQKGDLLTPAALGLVASLGIAQVQVVRRLKVAFFSTGDEILSLGETPREGAVYDSNRYTLYGLLTRLGCEPIDMGVVPDEPVQLEAAFLQAASQADAIITSGGVSMGEADHTRAMMARLGQADGITPPAGSGMAFWRIAMRPGRPMAAGRIFSSTAGVTKSAFLFGLPGNPVAVMVTFLAFVRPALLQMMGSTSTAPPLLKATSMQALRKKPGRTEYQRGIVSTATNGDLQVRITGNQGSGVLRSMVQANGLVVLHHNQGNVAAGDAVDVMVFDGVI
ncbi:MAG: molybdopterin molybdotransferase MoeA [Burkholderiales bacterium]